jgi:rfaE bifunctional protein nucleotidyltransferase chain/domain
MSKINTFKEIARICKKLKDEEKVIVFTNGCFDILHAGHIKLLKAAKAKGDILIVGLNTDGSIEQIKGSSRPFIRENDRAEILSALEMVDYVVLFPQDTPEKLIKIIKPDVLVKGGDYRRETVVGRQFVEGYGGKVILVPELKNRSTTSIVKKIQLSR